MSVNFIQSLFNHFTGAKKSEDTVPAGACPNCWGFYEYDNEVRNIIQDRQIDVENHQVTRAFIENFVANHVDGVRLREENGEGRCPSCGKVHPI